MKIGFFDSGIGGISVLTEAVGRIPDQEWLFDADTDHVPYGEKTTAEIAHYATDNARFLLSEGAEAIVVACNTATAAAIRILREMTQVPVIGMEPAVKPAVELLETAGKKKRILVTATSVTLREAKLKDLIGRVDPEHRVDLLPLPGLVTLAESGHFDTDDARRYLTDALSDVKAEDYSALVLGCTHFIYFLPLFREILGPEVHLIDGNAGTVRRLADVCGLPMRPDLLPEGGRADDRPQKRASIVWYQSGRRVTDAETLAFYGRLQDRILRIRNTEG